jgi:hypothetical protein
MAELKRPNNPGNLKVNDQFAIDNQATKSTGRVKVSAESRDPQGDVRIRVCIDVVKPGESYKPSQDKCRHVSEWENTPARGNAVCVVRLEGLAQNTRYGIRVWAEDRDGHQSEKFTASTFWTNRYPDEPKLQTPHDNYQFSADSTMDFTWIHQDPDPKDNQWGYQLRWRTVSSGGVKGQWQPDTPVQGTGKAGKAVKWTAPANRFRSNTFYEWQVRTADTTSHRWGNWATPFSFFATGVSKPPLPLSPVNGEAVDVSQPITFEWRFRDPTRTDRQQRADIRWRAVDEDARADAKEPPYWNMAIGSAAPGQPGATRSWTFPAGELAGPGYRYEWQVRTYDSAVAQPSDWSESAFLRTIKAPGGAIPLTPVFDPNYIQGSLGCGSYRVFLYDQGGEVYRGEITPLSQLQFGRLRDDISTALVQTIGFGQDCGALLSRTRSWMHELVIFRDGVRVWEGPITRITYTRDSVELEAKDCMAYLYRRIMRQGYNDKFGGFKRPHHRIGGGETPHGRSVVFRAYQIALNALAYHDPNLLPYITALIYDFVGKGGDAHQTRSVPDYSQTAWQQIDDLAATAGLDYVTIGRRIIFNDTHRPIGRLPQMRDGDFSDPPVVTEYGMQLCTYSAVTNNTGTWGAVQKVTDRHRYLSNGKPNPKFNDWYGPVEMVASSYSETEKSVAKMEEQAARNIAHRWPTPLVVRVPDNSTLNPDTNVGFQQLIPGVWIPLLSDATMRRVEQWQKLDSVTVTYSGGNEAVAVVMSPAPNGGADPDADLTAEEQG